MSTDKRTKVELIKELGALIIEHTNQKTVLRGRGHEIESLQKMVETANEKLNRANTIIIQARGNIDVLIVGERTDLNEKPKDNRCPKCGNYDHGVIPLATPKVTSLGLQLREVLNKLYCIEDDSNPKTCKEERW